MQRPVLRRLLRKRCWGHACACYACGAPVFPLPLRVNPDVDILRGYVRSLVVADRRTGQPHYYAILFCATHANPEDVRDYAQFETGSIHDTATHAASIAVAEAARCTSQL
jgi:hypothetical protein